MDLETFEADFQQWFMWDIYKLFLVEDWERYYAQQPKNNPGKCEHGKTPLTCEKCYWSK